MMLSIPMEFQDKDPTAMGTAANHTNHRTPALATRRHTDAPTLMTAMVSSGRRKSERCDSPTNHKRSAKFLLGEAHEHESGLPGKAEQQTICSYPPRIQGNARRRESQILSDRPPPWKLAE
jgi:hypothetical protein